jgi:hypothetical protein
MAFSRGLVPRCYNANKSQFSSWRLGLSGPTGENGVSLMSVLGGGPYASATVLPVVMVDQAPSGRSSYVPLGLDADARGWLAGRRAVAGDPSRLVGPTANGSLHLQGRVRCQTVD